MELDAEKGIPLSNTGSVSFTHKSVIKHLTQLLLGIKKLPENCSSIVQDDLMPEMFRFSAEIFDIDTESIKEKFVFSQLESGFYMLINKLTLKDGQYIMDQPPLLLPGKMKSVLDEYLLEPLVELVDDKKGVAVQGMVQGLGSKSHFTQKITKVTKETDESKQN